MNDSTMKWRQMARTYALTQLTHEHWELYRKLLAEQYAISRYGSPQSRAKTLLGRRFNAQLREIYSEELTRLLSLPTDLRCARRPPYVHVRPASTPVRRGAGFVRNGG